MDGEQQMSDKRATDKKSQKKDRRQIMRAKQMFKYRVQHFTTTYGPSVARQSSSSKLSGDSLTREMGEGGNEQIPAGWSPRDRLDAVSVVGRHPGALGRYRAPPRHRYPGTGYFENETPKSAEAASPQQAQRNRPQLPELTAEKQKLSQELAAARQAAAQVNQILVKNAQLKEERQEMRAMKEALDATMSGFNTIKESLLLNHKDLEKQWKGLVGSEAREEKERLRRQIDALQVKLNSMVGEQKRFARDFQDHFGQLTDEFRHVKEEMEASEQLVREKQQQSREHQALTQKFNTLVQKVKDMEEKLKSTRTKFQQVQASLVSNRKALAEAADDKMKLECELDSMKGEWVGQERLWGAEKKDMAEEQMNQMASRDRAWTKEREELFSEQKAIAEHLLTAQTRGQDLDHELEATRLEMQEQRRTLREKEETLEKNTANNKRLREDVAEKDETLFRFRKNIKAKDTEINELRNEVRELTDELDRLLDRKKKKFTLIGVIKKKIQKTGQTDQYQ